MVVGVYCEEKSEGISFEECIACGKCLPSQLIKSLRIFEYKPVRNNYYVREVIGCLRKAYFERKNSGCDTYLTLKELYPRKRGDLMGKITGASGWNELDGSLSYNVDGEDVKLSARLDLYDHDKHEIVELKSVENVWSRYLPKDSDVLQVQSYGVIFKTIFSVKRLRIVYLGMNDFRQVDIEMLDRSLWLKRRVETLHRSIRDFVIPEEEKSYSCNFCQNKGQCNQINAPRPTAGQVLTKSMGGKN